MWIERIITLNVINTSLTRFCKYCYLTLIVAVRNVRTVAGLYKISCQRSVPYKAVYMIISFELQSLLKQRQVREINRKSYKNSRHTKVRQFHYLQETEKICYRLFLIIIFCFPPQNGNTLTCYKKPLFINCMCC